MSKVIENLDNKIEKITDLYIDTKEKSESLKNQDKIGSMKYQIKWRSLWWLLYIRYRQRSFLKFVGC